MAGSYATQLTDAAGDSGTDPSRAPAGPATPPGLPEVDLLGVRFTAVTEAGCVEHILDELDRGRGGWVVTPNLDILRRLVRDRAFADLCAGASLLVADGMPLVWASRIQGTPLPERVAGSHLISSLSAGAARRGRSVFFLGGAAGTAELAGRALAERCPGLRVAGHFCPPMGFERSEEQTRLLEQALMKASPDIVFVGLGCPKQEHLIVSMRDRLPSTWWLGIGISFSYVCGHVRQAPRWAQRCGLEWAYRLAQEPGRLARRYLRDGLPFAACLLTSSCWRRMRGTPPAGG